jgi:hypothetical protein
MGEAVEFEPEFSIVSVRKDIAMAGAMTEEEKEEREGLEEVQTPKENGKLMNYAQRSLKYSSKILDWKGKCFPGNSNILIVCITHRSLCFCYLRVIVLEMTLKNQNRIHEEMKSRFISSNACYHTVQHLFSSVN